MRNIVIKSAVLSCGFQLAQVPWMYSAETDKWFDPLCNYEPATGSWAVCIYENLGETLGSARDTQPSAKATLENIHTACKHLSTPMTEREYRNTLANATAFFRGDGNTSIEWRGQQEEEGSGRASPIACPIKLQRALRQSRLHSLMTYYVNVDTSNCRIRLLFYYITAVVFVGLLFGLKAVRAKWLTSTLVSRVRARWTLPAVSEKHAQTSRVAQGLIPTRLEVCLILGYLLVHMAALAGGYTIDTGPEAEPIAQQRMRHISDRLAILSFAQLPLIILFSGRNSFVENLSGLRYTTSIVLHKWISRIMLADATAHGVLYGAIARASGTLEELQREQFWIAGVMALDTAIILIVSSLGYIRRRFYETFLILHIVFAALFFWALWVHVKLFGWTMWIWISVALWILEKVARLIRVIRFGGVVSARAELLDGEIIRLTIPKGPSSANWAPGQYAFVYILLPKIFWQSHPFSVVDLGKELLIVMKVKDGATRRLHQHLIASNSSRIRVLVEGPYGESCDVPSYDSRLLLCGGSGIPGPLSYVLHHNLPQTVLIIACRDFSLLEAFKPQILEATRRSNVPIYITRKLEHPTYGSTLESVGLRVQNGRPDLEAIFMEMAAYKGSLAVVTCGPPVFVDEARNTVAKFLRSTPQKAVDYVEEYQIW